MTQTKFGLAKEEVRQYHQQGWLGPFRGHQIATIRGRSSSAQI